MNSRILRVKHLARRLLAAGLLGLFAALCGCASTPPCHTAACTEDAGMADKISAALRAAPGVDFSEIHVQYRNGTVYLSGLVATRPQKDEIERIARETSGGKPVVNSIEMRGGRN